MKRRNVIAGLAATLTAGCSKISDSKWFGAAVDKAEDLHRGAHRAIGGDQALAPEYTKADISPFFRGNGTTQIEDPAYQAALENGFADWNLAITGLVERELSLSMAQLKAMPQRTQITRHDCVEGWSAIGQWTGPQLGHILDLAQLRPEAKFVVFHCADTLNGGKYYESVDLADAYHPQTIIAHELNEEPLPMRNGAPLRVRIERQLGYKSAKYLTGVEAVASLADVGQGQGGYWEDRTGYQWYAGI
ncbi:DMSO/TMAO reductase YedYZ molybdopterin-dependent catalytic subunit [Altererythrobacter atlanticus]|uniref:Sulfoxide reductase catalytic subunit YedY n=1 Tax=Croceibacterium atlanticum TaxID=1267766 RepID=A0A0F7KPZ0_9SPHN|nr:molybdopterin-dependent oxidoreductase [Croceibacterium atlanticum]AKH41201.1 Sulfoxide reductase catalytic subunit YedY precursor [Croceibacterium atlanticum]MBB5732719.1 DMSO/TMAO reductase YedYZ molybdopterin-dependent catalytic subunit [Croceibacterium atlanticum]